MQPRHVCLDLPELAKPPGLARPSEIDDDVVDSQIRAPLRNHPVAAGPMSHDHLQFWVNAFRPPGPVYT
jgi:hypothetical protein